MSKVSIIVPVFNARHYLGECINSVLNQSYSNFELILVNDGSTDGCSEICNYYGSLDSRVKVFNIENSGVSKARNFGIYHSIGEYLTFLDSDDTWAQNFLEVLVRETESTDLILSGLKKYSKHGDSHILMPQNKNYDLSINFPSFLQDNLFTISFEGACAKLYRTYIIKINKIEFIHGCQWGEDTLFLFKYLKYSKFVKTVAYAGYHYRYNQNSLSRRYNSNDALELHKLLKEHLKDLERYKEFNVFSLSLYIDYLICYFKNNIYGNGVSILSDARVEISYYSLEGNLKKLGRLRCILINVLKLRISSETMIILFQLIFVCVVLKDNFLTKIRANL